MAALASRSHSNSDVPSPAPGDSGLAPKTDPKTDPKTTFHSGPLSRLLDLDHRRFEPTAPGAGWVGTARQDASRSRIRVYLAPNTGDGSAALQLQPPVDSPCCSCALTEGLLAALRTNSLGPTGLPAVFVQGVRGCPRRRAGCRYFRCGQVTTPTNPPTNQPTNQTTNTHTLQHMWVIVGGLFHRRPAAGSRPVKGVDYFYSRKSLIEFVKLNNPPNGRGVTSSAINGCGVTSSSSNGCGVTSSSTDPLTQLKQLMDDPGQLYKQLDGGGAATGGPDRALDSWKGTLDMDSWKGSKAALAKWSCPHCGRARLSVMPWVAARWQVAGCGAEGCRVGPTAAPAAEVAYSCRVGPGEWSAAKAGAQELKAGTDDRTPTDAAAAAAGSPPPEQQLTAPPLSSTLPFPPPPPLPSPQQQPPNASPPPSTATDAAATTTAVQL